LKVDVYWHKAYILHDPGNGHPENPRRLQLALEGARRAGIRPAELGCEGDPWRAYARVHDSEYLERLARAVDEARLYGYPVYIDPDTYVSPGTLEALSGLACAVERLLGEAGPGRALLLLGRPPGHHAGVAGAALGAPTLGFCLLNTAALLATSIPGAVVFDFDVHHGNGTQEILGPPGVPHVDIHQDPATIYPGTGYPWEEGPRGSWYNIVVPPGAGDDILLDALGHATRILVGLEPRAVVVSMGFDGMDGDNYFAGLRAGPTFYYEAGRLLARLGAPVVAVLEGGYGRGLVEGLSAFIAGLRGDPPPTGDPTTSPPGVWERYRRLLERSHWLPGHA